MTTMFSIYMNSALSLISGMFSLESDHRPLKLFHLADEAQLFPFEPAPVFSLDEATMLKIFGFLCLEDVLRASLVCRWWYRLSFDRFLWKRIDLRRFSISLSETVSLQAFAVNRLAGKIHYLDLSGFTIAEASLAILARQCNTLRVLKLKSVTFVADAKSNGKSCNRSKPSELFPGHLDYLDIRLSNGNPRVYRAIASNLNSVKWLGICDAFFQALFADRSLEKTVTNMNALRKLDASHCLLLKDSALAEFKRCKALKVLSVRKCSSLTGTFIQGFLESCPSLKTLILDGISIDDDTLQNVNWKVASLKHLELGWCPLITSAGLKSSLPRITKISTLEYLGLCSVGDGRAMNDDILQCLAASLSCWRSKNLKSLNLSSSRYITQYSLLALRDLRMSVQMLDTTNCPAIERYPIQRVSCQETSYSSQGHDENNNDDIYSFEARKRKGSISATQFARSKYTLETPI